MRRVIASPFRRVASLRHVGSTRLSSSGGTTHFGFRDVNVGDKQELVGSVFHRVAKSYDLMNDLMSGSLHRLWKDAFVEMAGPLASPHSETVVLDVAGGTGDIAFRLHESLSRGLRRPAVCPRIIVSDINPSMLAVGKSRAEAKGLIGAFPASSSPRAARSPTSALRAGSTSASSGTPERPSMEFVVGNAEELPFPDNSVDLYTIAFGIRNVTNVPRALSEAHRVLKPGGRFMCLEFSHLDNPVMQQVYDAVSSPGQWHTADLCFFACIAVSLV